MKTALVLNEMDQVDNIRIDRFLSHKSANENIYTHTRRQHIALPYAKFSIVSKTVIFVHELPFNTFYKSIHMPEACKALCRHIFSLL